MTSENTPNPITNLVGKVMGSKSTPENLEQLTAELQKQYGNRSNVLAFISQIADPAVLLAEKKDGSITQISEKQCNDCDHAHIHHERYQTDSFIHLKDPLQKQQYHLTCFRESLASPCWDCSECYAENKLSAKDDLEHEAMPKYSWVWRNSKTINGVTGHLVYQVPEFERPIRTRDGFAIPWHRYVCEDHLPKNPAADLTRASRVSIIDLIEEDYGTTQARAEKCAEAIAIFGAKAMYVSREDKDYYGFVLDTTELVTKEHVAIMTLFDMSIVATMKLHPEITLAKLNVELARRMPIWSHNNFFPCSNAIGNFLSDIESQGFIKRRVNEDKSITLLSDFDNKEYAKCELPRKGNATLSFSALERAELNAYSSLQSLQATMDDISNGVLHLSTEVPFGLAGRATKASLDTLEAAIVKAHTIFEGMHSKPEGCQGAVTSWNNTLAKFQTDSKLPTEVIMTALATNHSQYFDVTPDFRKAVADLRAELEEFRVGLEACVEHVDACGRGEVHAAEPSSHGSSDNGHSDDKPSGNAASVDAPREAEK